MIFNKTALAMGVAASLVLSSCSGDNEGPDTTNTPVGTLTQTGTSTDTATNTGTNTDTDTVADAGINQIVATGVEFTLVGTGSDDLIYSWNINDQDYSGKSVVITLSVAGTYDAVLTVTDLDGTTHTDIITITAQVVTSNADPIVSAGVNITVKTGDDIVFSPVANDSDGDDLTYSWVIDSVTYVGATPENITITTADTYLATLTVEDGNGGTATDSLFVTVEETIVVNSTPTVSAGANITVKTGDLIVFSPVANDSDGDDLTYSWVINNATYAGATPANVSISAAATYLATVTVDDGNGGTATDSMYITVEEAVVVDNTAPVANAGVDQTVTTGVEFTLVGSGSDIDNDLLTYNWNINGVDYSGMSVDVILSAATTYNAIFTVMDSKGATHTDNITVTAQVPTSNTTPVVTAGSNITVETGELIVLNPVASDSDGDALTYSWLIDSVTYVGATPSNLSMAIAGTYFATVTVEDGNGGTATASMYISVEEAVVNTAPVADAGVDQTVTTGVEFTLVGTGTDADNDALTYSWNINGVVYSGMSVDVILSVATTYNAIFTVTDLDGATHTDTITVTAQMPTVNSDPIVSAGAYITVTTGEIVVLSPLASDSDGDVLTYSWIINNVTYSGATPANITLTSAGTYQATVTVDDGNGGTATDSTFIIVEEVIVVNADPIVAAGSNITVNTGDDIVFSPLANDSDGDTLTYSWVIDSVTYVGATPANVLITMAGTYLATVTVDDGKGGSATGSLYVTVEEASNPINNAPVANAGVDFDVETGVMFSLTGSGTDADNDMMTYNWNINGVDYATNPAIVTLSVATTYNAVLTVTDSNGASHSDSVIVTAADAVVVEGPPDVIIDPIDLEDAIDDATGMGEDSSGNVVYTPLEPGQVPEDVDPPAVITIDENGNVVEYELPRPHIFDYGLPLGSGYILDDFNDNDHQNNVGGAMGTMHCENYTEGGGYWYVFAGEESSITNKDGLPVNAYNIIEAVEDRVMEINLIAGPGDNGYAGVGTNIVFEEYPVPLDGLNSVEIRVKGTGTVVPMFEPNRIALGLDAESLGTAEPDWGNYAADPITLSNNWTVFTIPASEFIGEAYSLLGGDQGGDTTLMSEAEATKFFFQIKDGAEATIIIDYIKFNGSLSIADIPYKKEGVPTVEECGLIASIEDGSYVQGTPSTIPEPYLDWASVSEIPTPDAVTLEDTQLPAHTGTPNWLHVVGSKMYDSNDRQVRLTGVNWFGFETRALIPMGLWSAAEGGRTYIDMLDQIKALGFNTVRIPFSDEVISLSRGTLAGHEQLTFATPKTFSIDLDANDLTETDTPLDLLDNIADYAQVIGLKIILDSHSRQSDGYLVEGYWINPDFTFTMDDWIENWKHLAYRYKDNDAVVAMDLNNEPHFDAYWADPAQNGKSLNETHNWNDVATILANEILDVNPNVLIIVEGVERTYEDAPALEAYWWGGNLQGVRDNPIVLDFGNRQSKLVYSPHVYGPEVYVQPWFKDANFPNNLKYIWEDRFGFVNTEDLGHMLIGEFGIKNYVPGSVSNAWFEEFLTYIGDRKDGYSWTFWAWNPNSGDTGGILENDWSAVNTWKIDYLNGTHSLKGGPGINQMAPLIGNQNGQ
ncbi:MAG: PKD domain-containing protein [Pseudomonadales bacterium]|nr:PKD domain-containing protein [Pseudomonadales bacterium]